VVIGNQAGIPTVPMINANPLPAGIPSPETSSLDVPASTMLPETQGVLPVALPGDGLEPSINQ